MFVHICNLRKTFCYQQGQYKDHLCPNKVESSCRKVPFPYPSLFWIWDAPLLFDGRKLDVLTFVHTPDMSAGRVSHPDCWLAPK